MQLRGSVSVIVWLFLCLLVSAPGWIVQAAPVKFPGTASKWFGYDKHDFTLAGRHCIVVEPHRGAEGRPWIWRARFWGHEPQVDLALLEKGYHVVYMDVANLYGAPQAVAYWNQFYDFLTSKYHFAPKTVLEGMSRGGLIIYNWAAANPRKVACIYADAPVCDIKSWPGGKGKGQGSKSDWKKCLAVYGFSEEQALEYKHNPVDNLEPLAREIVPLLHVCGGADKVVPLAENTLIIQKRYRKLGGMIKVIIKKNVGHHPHSLKNPQPIVDFILKHNQVHPPCYFIYRGGLRNSYLRFVREKKARVAFMGGSITEREGFRPLVCAYLRERFPQTRFDFINAGLSSTGSTTGAFRMQQDVLRHGPIDLFIVEFAVNDNQDAHHTRKECIRGMEGIVRHALRSNPAMDMMFLYCANEHHVAAYQAKQTPLEIAAHKEVARYYGISSVNFARRIADGISGGQFTWRLFGGTHPAMFGNRIYAHQMWLLLEKAWSAEPVAKAVVPSSLPAVPLDPFNYENGRFLSLDSARLVRGWQIVTPDWKHLKGATRKQFDHIPLLVAEEPGAELQLQFTGKAVGIFVVAGPDAGVVEYSIDGRDYPPVDLFHHFSYYLHYPRTVMLAVELADKPHDLTLRSSNMHHAASIGTAVRIVSFVAN